MQGAFGRNRVGRLFRKGGNGRKKRCERGIKRISGRRGGWGWCKKQSFSRKCVQLHHKNAFFHSTMRDIILCYHSIMSDIIFIFFSLRRGGTVCRTIFPCFRERGRNKGLYGLKGRAFSFFEFNLMKTFFVFFRIRADAAFYTGMFVLFFNVYFFTIIFLLHLDRRGKVCYNLCNIAMVPCSALLRRYGRCVFEGFI